MKSYTDNGERYQTFIEKKLFRVYLCGSDVMCTCVRKLRIVKGVNHTPPVLSIDIRIFAFIEPFKTDSVRSVILIMCIHGRIECHIYI